MTVQRFWKQSFKDEESRTGCHLHHSQVEFIPRLYLKCPPGGATWLSTGPLWCYSVYKWSCGEPFKVSNPRMWMIQWPVVVNLQYQQYLVICSFFLISLCKSQSEEKTSSFHIVQILYYSGALTFTTGSDQLTRFHGISNTGIQPNQIKVK